MTERIEIGEGLWAEHYDNNGLGLPMYHVYVGDKCIGDICCRPPDRTYWSDWYTDYDCQQLHNFTSDEYRAIADFMDTLKTKEGDCEISHDAQRGERGKE